ncbi:MAG: Na+/H+ antiporter NhaC family protein [Anaerovorax sp.]
MEQFGIISLLPVAVILLIAVTTKRTLFAMVCGSIVGSAILAGKITGIAGTWFEYVFKAMADDTLEWLLLVIVLFGILIVLFEKSNAVSDFGLWAGKFIKTKRQALFGTFGLGIIVFLDDYLNNLAVGTTMKGITDELRIPRTQLAYVVNCVAAPVCVLIPLSSWAVYFGTLMEGQGVTVNGTGMGAYIQAIPLIFYAWFALLIVILQMLGVIPKLGLIKKDTARALETGNVFPGGVLPENHLEKAETGVEICDEARKKARPYNFLIPLAVMIIVTLTTGIDVLTGTLAGVIVALILYLVQKKLTLFGLLNCCYEGVLSMGFVVILSVLAFTVQKINIDLQLAQFVIDVTLPVMKGAFLPAAVFIVCAIYAYATGCFWDLAAIITPIVIPLATAMGVDPILAGAAIFSGAAFGSNTCLYGDGVILCAQSTEIKSIDLMMATLPYAAIAGGMSVIAYLIAGFVM